MGRKRREKLNRRLPGAPARTSGKTGSRLRWAWLLGVLTVAGVLIAGIGIGVRMNRPRFLQAAVLSSAAEAEAAGRKGAARIAFEDRTRLSDMTTQARVLAAHPALDDRAAGQIRFVLNALTEMYRDGNPRPEELDKAQGLLTQADLYLKQRRTRPPDAKP